MIKIMIEKLDKIENKLDIVIPEQATIKERIKTLIEKTDKQDNLITDSISGWDYQSMDMLMSEMDEMIKMKRVGGSFFYLILIMLAMLAIFDTQVLSIFRRQKEIGTYIAMGMTRPQVVGLFTVEGAMHAILAVVLGAIYGVPFLLWQIDKGFSMPAGTDDMGMAVAETIFPRYGIGLIVATVFLVLIITTIVSYMPSRKISKMNPTEAIKGKIQ